MIDKSKIVKGWKVITHSRKSAIVQGRGVMRTYEKGVWVHRCTHLGPLLAFDNHVAAASFHHAAPGVWIIVEAEVVLSHKRIESLLDWACFSHYSYKIFKKRWTAKNTSGVFLMALPAGTIQCQAIRCLE